MPCGVSVATASRSLRGVAKVSATRERVLDAARELSYGVTPRLFEADPAQPGAPVVAVILPFFSRWYFSTATAAAFEHLRANGYDVLLYHLGTAEVRDQFFETLPLAGRVQGVLSLSMPLGEHHTLALRALGLPLVSIGSHIDGWPSVGIDDMAASTLAVNHLLNQGHQRIGLIAGAVDDARFDFTASVARRLGYEQALNSRHRVRPGSGWSRGRTASGAAPRRWPSCWADRTCPPRCSPSSTSWPSVRSGRCAARGCRCRATCR